MNLMISSASSNVMGAHMPPRPNPPLGILHAAGILVPTGSEGPAILDRLIERYTLIGIADRQAA